METDLSDLKLQILSADGNLSEEGAAGKYTPADSSTMMEDFEQLTPSPLPIKITRSKKN